LAAMGVTYLTVALGEVPWIALTLAFSFGFYGLLRKVAAVGALEGLTIETLVLLPVAGSYLAYLGASGQMVFAHRDARTDALLVAAGAVTALPLLWFSNAARRLRLATVGFLQYLAPSLQLSLGVVLYGEPFARHHQITFAFIWTALAIYSVETFRGRPRKT
jgi:chloramphenicol-sensitive protein RarD